MPLRTRNQPITQASAPPAKERGANSKPLSTAATGQKPKRYCGTFSPRRIAAVSWVKLLDSASHSPTALKDLARLLLEAGPAAQSALGKIIVACSAPGSSALARTRKRTLIKLLRTAVPLINLVLKIVLPRYMNPSRRSIQDFLSSQHNLGEGLPLGEEGIAKNYELEVLRMDEAGRLYRRVKMQDGSPAKYVGSGCSSCCGGKCSKCCGGSTGAATPFGGSTRVEANGLLKRFTCRLNASLLKAPEGLTKEESRQRQISNQNRDVVTERADRYLKKKCCWPFSSCLQKCLPRRLKASLDFEYPSDFLPRLLRDAPNDTLSLELNLALSMRFDSRAPLYKIDFRDLDDFTAVTTTDNDARLVLHIRGKNGFPSVGTVEIKSLMLETSCLAWWDVFDSTFDLAFKKEDPPRIKWDLEVKVGSAGCPLPDCIEDRLFSFLTRIVMSSFNRAYPLHINLRETEEREREQAKRLDELDRLESEFNGTPLGKQKKRADDVVTSKSKRQVKKALKDEVKRGYPGWRPTVHAVRLTTSHK